MRTEQRVARAEQIIRRNTPGKPITIIIESVGAERLRFRTYGYPETTLERMQARVIAERGYRVRLEETAFSGGYHDCRIVPADDLTPEEMERMATWEAAHPEVPPEPPDPRGWQKTEGNGSV